MKTLQIRTLVITAILLLPGICPLYAGRPQGPNIMVGTCNVRCLSAKDDGQGDGWEVRSPWLFSFLEFMSPDLLGTQEVTYRQKLDMTAALPEYGYIGVGRKDGKDDGEHELIFFRKDRFKLLSHGDFWMSETPERPSKGWDAALPRICTWGCFRDRTTHKKIWMFNIHNDHKGVEARRQSAKLVVSRIKEMTGPRDIVFLTGDFNVDQTNEIYSTYTTLLEDSFETAALRYAPNGTFNAFKTDSFTESRIDHIFVSPGTEVVRYGIFTETYRTENENSGEAIKSANFPSEVGYHVYTARNLTDHFPVFIKARL